VIEMITVMSLKKQKRIVLDIAMTVLLLCAYACRITGKTVHIWIGVIMFVLFAVHIFINRSWIKAIFKGTYTPYRILLTAVNTLLALSAATQIITGILEALWKPAFSQFESGITVREIHTTAAYWFMPLAGIHLGLHWGMFTKFLGKNQHVITAMRIIAFLFFIFGLWSFFDRDMFSKLFLGFSFDYWPQERPVILFFVQTLSVMGIYVIATYYILRLIYRLENKKSKTGNGG
jgi:hypothetical protein